jgi:hypothetical protein
MPLQRTARCRQQNLRLDQRLQLRRHPASSQRRHAFRPNAHAKHRRRPQNPPAVGVNGVDAHLGHGQHRGRHCVLAHGDGANQLFQVIRLARGQLAQPRNNLVCRQILQRGADQLATGAARQWTQAHLQQPRSRL